MELFLIEGFGNEIAPSRLKSSYDIIRTVQGRQEDNRNLSGRLRGFQLRRHFESVHAGHHDVQQNQVGPSLFDDPDCLQTVRSRDDPKTLFLKQYLQQQDVRHNVVYGQNRIFGIIEFHNISD